MSNMKQEPKNPANDGILPAEPVVSVKSQTEIDQEMSLVRLRAEKLRLKKEELELAKLENDVLEIQRKNEQQRIARETVQESLSFERDNRINHETNCNHMKGGDSSAMMNGGPAQGDNAGNYALIQHTYITGVTFRMCLRCGKTWFPKDPDYQQAMMWPTRNSPSTGCPSPGLVRYPHNARVVSEVPHRNRVIQGMPLNIPEFAQ